MKRLLRLFFAGLFSVLFLHQITATPIAHCTEQQQTREATAKASYGFPMQVHRGLPIVDVWVNGRGPFRFGVDTGAMYPVVFRAGLAEKIGLARPEAPKGEPGSTGIRDKPTVQVDSIRVGDTVFTGIFAVLVDLRSFGPPVEGTLGLPLFKDFLLTLDYPGSRMRIERAELPEADGKTVLPIEKHPTGLALVDLEVEGETLSALVDTGNLAAAFVLPKSLVTRLGWASDSSSTKKARTLGQEFTVEEVRLSGAIRLGEFVFSQPVVVFGDTFGKALIGGQAFREHAVSIDQKNWRLRVVRYPGVDSDR